MNNKRPQLRIRTNHSRNVSHNSGILDVLKEYSVSESFNSLTVEPGRDFPEKSSNFFETAKQPDNTPFRDAYLGADSINTTKNLVNQPIKAMQTVNRPSSAPVPHKKRFPSFSTIASNHEDDLSYGDFSITAAVPAEKLKIPKPNDAVEITPTETEIPPDVDENNIANDHISNIDKQENQTENIRSPNIPNLTFENDEDATKFRKLVVQWMGLLERSIVTDFISFKSEYAARTSAILKQSNEDNIARIEKLQSEISLLKESIENNSVHLRRSKMLNTAVFAHMHNQYNVVLLSRTIHKWRSRVLWKSRESMNLIIATKHCEKKRLHRIFDAWKFVCRVTWRATMEKKIKSKAEGGMRILSEEYEAKIKKLQNELLKTQKSLIAIQSQQSKQHNEVRQALLRGVSALNMETMSILTGDLESKLRLADHENGGEEQTPAKEEDDNRNQPSESSKHIEEVYYDKGVDVETTKIAKTRTYSSKKDNPKVYVTRHF